MNLENNFGSTSLTFSSFNENENETYNRIKLILDTNLNKTDLNLIEQEIKDKYSVDKLNDSITTFKNEIIKLYEIRSKLENEYTLTKNKLNIFTDQIQSLIKSVDDINLKTNNNDDSFKNDLLNKLNEYKFIINIESIQLELQKVTAELYYLHSSISSYLSIQHPCICTICLESKIEYFIDPCGHTLCTNCKNKMNDTCYYCRSKINIIRKLYLLDS